MPYCTICGLELSNANQRFCERCRIKIKTQKEKNIIIPITPSIPKDIPLQEQKLFEIFVNYFVPVDYSNLYLLIPPNDQVLSSLLATRASKVYHSGWEHFTTHFIITKSGIAFSIDRPLFFYWNDVRLKLRGKIIFEENRLYIGNYLMKKKRKETGIYEKDKYILLRRNFIPLCKLLKKNFLVFIEELKKCVTNINLLKEYINSYSTEEFIDKLNIFHNAGLWKEAEIILDNTLELINREERKEFLNIIIKFAQFSKKEENYEKALKYNNLILELNPSDAIALKNKKIIQEILNYKSIPFKDRRDAVKLCKKGLKLCEKDQLKEGLELIKRANEKSPYDGKIKEALVKVLQKLGRDDEIKNYIED